MVARTARRPHGAPLLSHLDPLVAVMLWGGVYPAGKLGLREIPALSFTSLRMLVATVVLVGLIASTQRLMIPPLGRCLVEATLAQAAFQACLVAGLARTTAGNSAILLAVAPLVTALWLRLAGRERLAPRQWCGLALGLAGVVPVVGASAGFARTGIAGDLLALGAAAAWAWYGIAIAPLVASLGALQATGWTMALAAALFTPLAIAQITAHPWGAVSTHAWIGLLYGATAGMVVAMALWGRSVHRLGPTQTTVYLYLEPVSAVVLAAVLLREPFSPGQAFGAILALAGVWLVRADRERRTSWRHGTSG